MNKPTSMTVLGILNICFAGLGLLGGCWGLVAPFIPMPGAEMLEDLYADGTFLAVTLGLALIGICSKVAMGLSGIGLVKGKAWGRSLGNLWAMFSILYGLVVMVVQATYVLPKTFDAQQAWLQTQPNVNSQQVQMMQSMEGVTIVMTVVMGILMATVYQVLFLILNNRKAVKDYLASGGGDGSGMGQVPQYGQPAPPTEPTDSPW